jgi:Aerobic-type carbon monoxide dehydrogenase, middle subunit CoxM/CutM homologs
VLNIQNYVKVNDLEEAYVLNQKRTNIILGGMLWLKMGNRNIVNAIDLSALGLDKIEEDEKEFSIGCMCSLRDLEQSLSLNQYFNNAFKECTRHIVGVQFRNCATIGGSVFGRYGFSDILTCLQALDTYVELYKGGLVALEEFMTMARDNDILVRVIIKKDKRNIQYISQRMTKTDFPIIACAVAEDKEKYYISIGARPARATLQVVDKVRMNMETIDEVIGDIVFGTNMRGSEIYRRHLAKVLVKRCLEKL